MSDVRPIFPTFDFENGPHFDEEERDLEEALARFQKTLTAAQREMLIDVIDNKDWIAALTAEHYYEKGFRTGAKLMIDGLYFDE